MRNEDRFDWTINWSDNNYPTSVVKQVYCPNLLTLRITSPFKDRNPSPTKRIRYKYGKNYLHDTTLLGISYKFKIESNTSKG